MHKDIKAVVKNISNVRTLLGTLDLNDSQGIIDIGAMLEELALTIPEELPKAADCIYLCLEALQAIYEKNSPDPNKLIKAVISIKIAIEQHVASLGNPICEVMLNQAKQALEAQLVEIRKANFNKSKTANIEDISIDSIAMLLIELDLDNSSQILELKNALTVLLQKNSFEYKAKENLLQAKELVESLTLERTPNKEAILTKISSLIEPVANGLASKPDSLDNLNSSTVNKEVSDIVDKAKPAEQNSLNPDLDANLIQEFVIESNEYVEASEAALLSLETDPNNLEAVNTVFRAFHTIKGTSAFLGLKHLSTLTHQAESLLSRIRDREINCVGKYADLALRSIDMVKEMLVAIERAMNGQELANPDGHETLLEALAQAINESVEQITKQLVRPTSSKQKADLPINEKVVNASSTSATATAQKDLDELNNQINSHQKNEKRSFEKTENPVVKENAATPAINVTATEKADLEAKMLTKEKVSEVSVRVRTDRLDKLIDTIGELVIAQSMIAQDDTVANNSRYELNRKVVHMGKIVRELQDLSMTMRMVPLKASFQKMNRLVRDLSRQCGKSIELITEGEDTEIDRNMVDIINDPLVHMLRNAIDHGIEDLQVREAKGKPRTGCIRLSACNAGDNIVIKLSDDGQGLDINKILNKAVSKGLLEAGTNLSEHEIFNLIFAPGFSTAEKVTNLSGRGVGMDVVKRSIEALSGNIEISSELDKGCCFSIKLPLTLAITDAMLVRVGKERYIIPTSSIYLSFRPHSSLLSSVTGRGEMVLLQGELMPIFRLHRLFKVADAKEDPTQALLVIVADGKRRCALLIDELLGQQQVVAKSLGGGVGKVPGISGGAILGDGCVGLILDCAELILLARQLSAGKNLINLDSFATNFLTEGDKKMNPPTNNATDKKMSISELEGKYLTFFLGEEEYGIEILKVQEIIALMAITRIPNTPHFMCGVINLRGKIIAVVNLRAKFDMSAQTPTAHTCIIVVRSAGLEIGIMVDKVSEVLAVNCKDIEESPVFGVGVNTEYLLGIAKVQGRVKLLLDIDKVLSNKELVALQAITKPNEAFSSNLYKSAISL